MNYLNFNPKWHKNEDISCLSELIEDEYLCQRRKRMNTISKKITAILLAFCVLVYSWVRKYLLLRWISTVVLTSQ